jgi:hypothetical protein
VAEPTFLTTQIAVLAPAPAHAGDAVTIVIRLQAAYDGHDAQRSYSASTTSTLYGPFPSLAALQGAVASRSNGPPSGTGLPLLGDLSTSITASDSGVVTTTFHLPHTLSPGFYDIVIIATLRGSRAAARTDVPLQIVAGGWCAVPRGPNHSAGPRRSSLHDSAAGKAGSFLGAITAGFLYGLDPGAPFMAAAALFLVSAAALFLPALTQRMPVRRALEVAA